MTKSKAIALAAFTVWPFVYMLLFMASFLLTFATMGHQQNSANEIPWMFKIIIPLHIFTMLEVFVLIAIYIIHLFKTASVAQDKKALWAVVLFMGNIFAMPVYWYLHVWKPFKSRAAA